MPKDSNTDPYKTDLRDIVSPPDENAPLRNSRQAKIAFGISLFNVVYFFLLHAVIEAFLLGGRANPLDPLGTGLIILYFVLPAFGMIFCAVGLVIALKDLRLPYRSREFSLMAFVINLVILIGLLILLALTIIMR